MEQDRIKLLIVEDNLEMCEILKDFFRITPEIDLCGIAHNGQEALHQIFLVEPDVVLLDIIMPTLDGISVLERLKESNLDKKPCIIVASAISQESITNRALSLGASYYMIKPYNLSDLLSRIILITSSTPKNHLETKEKKQGLRGLIAKYIIDMGMTTNVLGYPYCVEAVYILINSKHRCSIVKDIYTAVADKYNTTPECVESAIRKAIHRIFLLNNEVFQEITSFEGAYITKQPSNGRFLTMLSEYIKLNLDLT